MTWEVGLALAGRYRLDGPLGEGNAGGVWSATHLPTGRRVAIRQLEAAPGVEVSDDVRARFVLQAKSTCVVEHPNAVEVCDVVDRAGEPPLLVMELLRGETLAQKLSRQPKLSVREVAALLLPVVSAIGTAHARGVVHGELKPSSIFLWQGDGAVPAVKVLDFGVAKWVAESQPPPSVRIAAGSMQVTSSYRAPEQGVGQRSIDHRADIWALGVIAYECLSGARPVESANVAQGGAEAAPWTILPIERRVPSVPRTLADVIGHMLVRDPEHRAQNLLELFHVLGSMTDLASPSFGWPGSERRITGLTQRASVPAFSFSPSASPSPWPASTSTLSPAPESLAPGRPRTTWRSIALAALSVAALELAALLWLAFRPSPEGQVAVSKEASTEARGRVASSVAAAPLPEPSVAASSVPESSHARVVQAIQPAPAALIVDDFEDGNGIPLQPGLNNWESFTYNPSGRGLRLNLGEGRASQGSLEMPWRAEDTKNGQPDHPGAGVRSVANPGPIDLSKYSRLVFSHRFEQGPSAEPQCKKARTLVFQVTCRRLRQDYLPQFELSVPMSPTWAASVVLFSDLRETSATSPRATPVRACLAMADGVAFRVDAPPDVHDGECHSGTLWLDDIAFR